MIYGMKPKNLSYPSSDYLAHYGVDGQKWGERKYQNPDGSLTPEGRIHYGVKGEREAKKIRRENYIKKYKERSSKDITEMTDEELQAAVKRMQLENQYSTQVKLSKGYKYANEKQDKQAAIKKSAIIGLIAGTGSGVATGVIAKLAGTDVKTSVISGAVTGVSSGITTGLQSALRSPAFDKGYDKYQFTKEDLVDVGNAGKELATTIKSTTGMNMTDSDLDRLSEIASRTKGTRPKRG